MGQESNAVALGANAGTFNQGGTAIAIGYQAGYTGQGPYAIAIGYQAGLTGQNEKSIVLNATGTPLNAGTTGFFVAPVRGITATYLSGSSGQYTLFYDNLLSEIKYFGLFDNINISLTFNGTTSGTATGNFLLVRTGRTITINNIDGIFAIFSGSAISTTSIPTNFRPNQVIRTIQFGIINSNVNVIKVDINNLGIIDFDGVGTLFSSGLSGWYQSSITYAQ